MKKYLFLLFLGAASCQSSSIDLGKDIDLRSFKSDRGGCDAKRAEMINQLETAKDSLLSHSENEVLASLGRYDFQILDSRNEKIFMYYLEPGPHCEQIQNESQARSMAIHLNSVSLVKEVTFQQSLP